MIIKVKKSFLNINKSYNDSWIIELKVKSRQMLDENTFLEYIKILLAIFGKLYCSHEMFKSIPM